MQTKLVSWNVNGIRAITKKGFSEKVRVLDPDVLCLQETKAQDHEVVKAISDLDHYHIFTNSAERKGYSGTAVISKTEPIRVTNDIGVKVHDKEGRVITAEYTGYFLVNTYVPNSGSELVRLAYRKTWDKAFRRYLKSLAVEKPVILTGDLNVAHQPIDLARPKSNYNKTAGYTQAEIDGFSRHLKAGFIDTFRHLHPDKVAYSYWSYRLNAKAKNIGWRIDYFLVTKDLMPEVKASYMERDIDGSDHCPIVLELG